MWVDSPCSRMASCRLLRPPFKLIFTANFLFLPPKKKGFWLLDSLTEPHSRSALNAVPTVKSLRYCFCKQSSF